MPSSSLNNKIPYYIVFPLNRCIMSPLKFLVVHVLFIMSTNVTFFEETPFFSSSMQNPGSIQQILPVPSFGPMILPTQDLSNQEGHQP